MTEFMYSLNITTHIDDYKTRGENPETDFTLHKTREDMTEYLRNFLKNHLIRRKTYYATKYKLDYVEKSGFKHLFVLDEIGKAYEFNENAEILVGDMPKIYEKFCKGDFIPYRFTYEIIERTNHRD